MKNKLKITFLISCIFFLTACTIGSSEAEKVAKGYVKDLSNGVYDINKYLDITGLHTEFYNYKEDNYKNFLDYYNLNIKGNKKVKIDNIKYREDGTKADVKVNIDNGLFEVALIKIGDKWYIDNEYIKDKEGLVIEVPKGTKIKINDKEVDSSFKERNTTENFGGKSFEKEVYKIPNLIAGSYNAEFTLNGGKLIKKELYSYNMIRANENSDNVEYNYNKYNVKFDIDDNNKQELENFVKLFYDKMLDNLNASKEINNMSTYFKNIDSKKYTDILNNTVKKEPSLENKNISYFHDFKISNEIFKTYVEGDNLFLVQFNYKLDYISELSYYGEESELNSINNKSKNNYNILIIEKVNNDFIIKDSNDLLPIL